MSKRSRSTRDTEVTPPGPTKLFLSYCHDPISLLPITPEQDDHIRKFRVDYEKARVCNLSQTLTDAQIYVTVDLFASEEKSDAWAEEQLKQCDYFILVISESYFQFICQQHTSISLQTSLPKLRTLENFVNELPNRTIVVSFTPDPNNIIPPVLADVDVIHLMDMPKLTLQKNFEQLLTKIRPGYDTVPEECVQDVHVTVTSDTGLENGEVTDASKEETVPSSDKIGELPTVENKKKEKPLQLKLFNHTSDLNVCRPRRSVATPLITPGVQQTSEMSIAGKKVIDISYKDIKELPLDLPYHEDLHVLWLSNNKLNHLEVVKLSSLNHLEELYAHCNLIQTYPTSLCDCFNKLRILWLSTNELNDLPGNFCNLTGLRHLHLCENYFTTVPAGVLGLKSLKVLYMNHNRIVEITDEIAQMESLERLYLNDNLLEYVSDELTKISKLKKVMMLDNHFLTFPSFVGDSKLSFNLGISSLNDPNLTRIQSSPSTPQFTTSKYLAPTSTRPRLSDN